MVLDLCASSADRCHDDDKRAGIRGVWTLGQSWPDLTCLMHPAYLGTTMGLISRLPSPACC